VLVDTNEDCFDRHVALYLSALQPQSTWKGYNRSGSGSFWRTQQRRLRR
jgi:hypothetical protein